MEQERLVNKAIAYSDYMLGSWISLNLFLSGIMIGGLLSMNISNWLLWIFIPSSVILSCWMTSYLFLNKTAFFANKIEINYFIKHDSKKKHIIEIENIVAFRYIYIGGKGSAGNGQLKVYYKTNRYNKILKCAINRSTAAKICLAMKSKGVQIEVKPSWLLSEYGYPGNESH